MRKWRGFGKFMKIRLIINFKTVRDALLYIDNTCNEIKDIALECEYD